MILVKVTLGYYWELLIIILVKVILGWGFLIIILVKVTLGLMILKLKTLDRWS